MYVCIVQYIDESEEMSGWDEAINREYFHTQRSADLS